MNQPTPTLVRLSDADWIPMDDGVDLAPLRVEGPAAGAAFLRFEPGGRSPSHRHPAGEDLCVVSGTIRVGDHVLSAGDFLHTPAGGIHDAEALAPTVVLVSVPEAVEFLESAG